MKNISERNISERNIISLFSLDTNNKEYNNKLSGFLFSKSCSSKLQSTVVLRRNSNA